MGWTSPNWTDLESRAAAHLTALLRLNTTNPPGNESLVAEYVADTLQRVGIEPVVKTETPGRDNVVARIQGNGELGPLLLASHADVVTVEEDKWTHPPFAGVRAEGCFWGRGALDMKCATAMHLAALESIAKENLGPLRRDLILAVVADEEAGMVSGSRFLVDEHPDLVRAEYALGEFGGFTATVMGHQIFLVQIAEKGVCWVRGTAKGTPGHGSVPSKDNAVVRLAQAVEKIGRKKLPIHLTEPARHYLEALSAALPQPARAAIRLLLKDPPAGLVLDFGLRDPKIWAPMLAALTNTATPTTLHAGSKINVIPAEATVEIDGRTLPGYGPSDFLDELKKLAPELDYEVIDATPSAQATPDTPVFRAIDGVLRRLAPGRPVVPFLLPSYTDAKSWSALGTICYGFVPLLLPEDFPPVFELVHGHDERVPEEAFFFGVRALFEVLEATCGGSAPQT